MDLVNLKPSDTPSPTSGGTAHILERERKRATFDSGKLCAILHGGAENLAQQRKWQELFDSNPIYDRSKDAFLDRKELFEKSIARAMESVKILRANPDLLNTHMPGGKGQSIGALSHNYSGITDHYSLFVGTLWTQATPEQQKEWLPKAMKLQIIGTYAQTELGHGSNVRGLETTATYDPQTKEFIINSPTLTSLKWWPGALGVISTHAIIYARLILKGKDYGFHSFMVQLRDEEHKPLPGVVVGDIGPKMGYGRNDSGYCGFKNVRVPRFNMLARFQQVTEDGEYRKPPRGLEKIGYQTMTKTRVGIALSAYRALAGAVTIAVRYSAVRKQGFVDTKAEDPVALGEVTTLDYQSQQYILFSQVATAYAIFFGCRNLRRILAKVDQALKERDPSKVDTSMLPELHGTSAGLKAMGTVWAVDGMEAVRRCCGGQGYAHSSGLSTHFLDYLPAVTYEGDRIVMALQTARFLVNQVNELKKNKPLPGAMQYLKETPGKGAATSEQVQDASLLLPFFHAVAKRSIFHAAELLEARIRAGEPFDKAWNACHLALLRATEDHIVFTTLSAFVEAVNEIRAIDEAIGKVLGRLAALFALYRIKSCSSVSSWSGVLSPNESLAVESGIPALLDALRPDAVALVDAFGATDSALDSAIGRYDGNVYEHIVHWAVQSPLNSTEWQQEVWRKHLKPSLDGSYLAQAKRLQSAKL